MSGLKPLFRDKEEGSSESLRWLSEVAKTLRLSVSLVRILFFCFVSLTKKPVLTDFLTVEAC